MGAGAGAGAGVSRREVLALIGAVPLAAALGTTPEAIERAVQLAEVDIGGLPGVLIIGSVIAISEARALLVREEPVAVPAASTDLDDEWDVDYSEDGHETDRDWR